MFYAELDWPHPVKLSECCVRMKLFSFSCMRTGKSTLACSLGRELHSRGKLSYVLDGDNLRHGLNKNLGFAAEDRVENIRRVGKFCIWLDILLQKFMHATHNDTVQCCFWKEITNLYYTFKERFFTRLGHVLCQFSLPLSRKKKKLINQSWNSWPLK